MGYAIVVAGVLLVVFAPALLERMRRVIGPRQRKGAEGGFAELSQGVTHYRWVGPVRGPVAVLVHGLASPQIAMQGLADGLGQMGYRVLTYDLYGRGLSDAPQGPQDRAFFLRQLAELLENQSIQEEITFVGYSMGGQIVAAHAAENPHMVNRVIMIDSYGVENIESDFSCFCRRVPVLGDWWHGMFVRRRILSALPVDSRSPYVESVLIAQRAELSRRGYLPSILASRRGLLHESAERDHRKLAHEDVPVVAIWAENDQVIPIAAKDVLATWNRTAKQEVVAGADHAVPYTHRDELLEALRHAMHH